jgi:hypothetical protein
MQTTQGAGLAFSVAGKAQNKLKEWRDSTHQFAVECCNMKPTSQQIDLFNAFDNNNMISVRSGHGTGKDASASIIILKFLTCFPYPKIPCTGPTGHQLRDVLWAEIHKWLRQSKVKDEFVWNNERIYLKSAKEEWFAVARSVNVRGTAEDQAETFAGFHADALLYVVDESSGVPAPVFGPIEGGLTGKNNKALLIGNMTKKEGYFYDTHFHEKVKDLWFKLHWDSRKSSLVTDQWVNFFINKYGQNSNVFRIRVMGEPPLEDENYQSVIPFAWANQCIDNEILVGTDEPKYLGVDVARYGDDKSIILPRTGLDIHEYHEYENMNTIELGGWINHHFGEEEAAGIAIDEIGVGAGVTDWLEKKHDSGIVHGVNVSNRPNDLERFSRLRDELWWAVRENCMKKRYRFPFGEKGRTLVDELSTPRYELMENKIKVESKKKMRLRGVASPNVAEALLMSEVFALNATTTWPKDPPATRYKQERTYNDPLAWMSI